MKLLTTKNHAISANVANWKDPAWWIKDDHGFKATYLLSAHVHTQAEFPRLKLLHLIAGPVRVVIAWNKVKATWVGPLYGIFALQLVNLRDQLLMARTGWMFWSLLMLLWTGYLIAQEVQKGER